MSVLLDPDGLEVVDARSAEEEFDELLFPARPSEEDIAAAVQEGRIEDLVLSLVEAAVATYSPKKFDEDNHPRWPKGTPRAGQFMRVGQWFKSKDGRVWQVTHASGGKPGGKLMAAEASGDVTKAETREFATAFDAVDGPGVAVPGIVPAPPKKLAGGKNAKPENSPTISPYVDPSTHNPSIPLPEGSKLSPEDWKQFGEDDQLYYVELMERFGSWKAASAGAVMKAAASKLDSQTKQAIFAAIDKQKGGSGYWSSGAGQYINFASIFNSLGEGSTPSAATWEKYEKLSVAFAELNEVAHWDLFNRVKAPDIALFHGGESGVKKYEDEFIGGKKAIYSAFSQAWNYASGAGWAGYGSNGVVLATPTAIRHIGISYFTPPGHHPNWGENELCVAPRMALDERSVAFHPSSFNVGTPAAQAAIKKFLTGHTGTQAAPGSIIQTLRDVWAGKGGIPIPPEPANLKPLSASGGSAYEKIPAELEAKILKQGVDAGYHTESGEKGDSAGILEQMDLKPGDFIEGKQGTRYVIIVDPDDQTSGLRYVKIRDKSGQPVGSIDYGKSFPFSASAGNEFYKLTGHVALPKKKVVGFAAWTEDDYKKLVPGEKKKMGELPVGAVVKIEGEGFEIEGSHTTSAVLLKSLDTGKQHTASKLHEIVPLIKPEGFVPPTVTDTDGGMDPDDVDDLVNFKPKVGELVVATKNGVPFIATWTGKESAAEGHFVVTHAGTTMESSVKPEDVAAMPVKLGAASPEPGDIFHFGGEKFTVTSVLKDGTVRARPKGGTVQKFKPDDAAFKALYRPDIWQLGDKAKLKDVEIGQLVSGSDAKARPYLVVQKLGSLVRLMNLETGEVAGVSGNKSRRIIEAAKPKEDHQPDTETKLLPDPATGEPLPTPKKYDLDLYTQGESAKPSQLADGDLWIAPTGKVAVAVQHDDAMHLHTLDDDGVVASNSAPVELFGEPDGTKLVPKVEAGTEKKFVGALPVGTSFEYLGYTYVKTGEIGPGTYSVESTNGGSLNHVYNTEVKVTGTPEKPKPTVPVTASSFDMGEWQSGPQQTLADMPEGTVFLSATGLPLLLKSKKPKGGASALALHNGKTIKNLPYDKAFTVLTKKDEIVETGPAPGTPITSVEMADALPEGTVVALTDGTVEFTKVADGKWAADGGNHPTKHSSSPFVGGYKIVSVGGGVTVDPTQFSAGQKVFVKHLALGATVKATGEQESDQRYVVTTVPQGDQAGWATPLGADGTLLVLGEKLALTPDTEVEFVSHEIDAGPVPVVEPVLDADDDYALPTAAVTPYGHHKSGTSFHHVATDFPAGTIVQDKSGKLFEILKPSSYSTFAVAHDGEKKVSLPVHAGDKKVYLKAVTDEQKIAAFKANKPTEDQLGPVDPTLNSKLSWMSSFGTAYDDGKALVELPNAGVGSLVVTEDHGVVEITAVSKDGYAGKVLTSGAAVTYSPLQPVKMLAPPQGESGPLTGTAWADEMGLRVGDSFFGGNGQLYTVANKPSNYYEHEIAVRPAEGGGHAPLVQSGFTEGLITTPGGFKVGQEVSTGSYIGKVVAVAPNGQLKVRATADASNVPLPEVVLDTWPIDSIQPVPTGDLASDAPAYPYPDDYAASGAPTGISGLTPGDLYVVPSYYDEGKASPVFRYEGQEKSRIIFGDGKGNVVGPVDMGATVIPVTGPGEGVKKPPDGFNFGATMKAGSTAPGEQFVLADLLNDFGSPDEELPVYTKQADGKITVDLKGTSFPVEVSADDDVIMLTPRQKKTTAAKFGDLKAGDTYFFPPTHSGEGKSSTFVAVAEYGNYVAVVAQGVPFSQAEWRPKETQFASQAIVEPGGTAAHFEGLGQVVNTPEGWAVTLTAQAKPPFPAADLPGKGVTWEVGVRLLSPSSLLDDHRTFSSDEISDFKSAGDGPAQPGDMVKLKPGTLSGQKADDEFEVVAVGENELILNTKPELVGNFARIGFDQLAVAAPKIEGYATTEEADGDGKFVNAGPKKPVSEFEDFELARLTKGRLAYHRQGDFYLLGGEKVTTKAALVQPVKHAFREPSPDQLDNGPTITMHEAPVGAVVNAMAFDYIVLGKSDTAMHLKRLESGQIFIVRNGETAWTMDAMVRVRKPGVADAPETQGFHALATGDVFKFTVQDDGTVAVKTGPTTAKVLKAGENSHAVGDEFNVEAFAQTQKADAPLPVGDVWDGNEGSLKAGMTVYVAGAVFPATVVDPLLPHGDLVRVVNVDGTTSDVPIVSLSPTKPQEVGTPPVVTGADKLPIIAGDWVTVNTGSGSPWKAEVLSVDPSDGTAMVKSDSPGATPVDYDASLLRRADAPLWTNNYDSTYSMLPIGTRVKAGGSHGTILGKASGYVTIQLDPPDGEIEEVGEDGPTRIDLTSVPTRAGTEFDALDSLSPGELFRHGGEWFVRASEEEFEAEESGTVPVRRVVGGTQVTFMSGGTIPHEVANMEAGQDSTADAEDPGGAFTYDAMTEVQPPLPDSFSRTDFFDQLDNGDEVFFTLNNSSDPIMGKRVTVVDNTIPGDGVLVRDEEGNEIAAVAGELIPREAPPSPLPVGSKWFDASAKPFTVTAVDDDGALTLSFDNGYVLTVTNKEATEFVNTGLWKRDTGGSPEDDEDAAATAGVEAVPAGYTPSGAVVSSASSLEVGEMFVVAQNADAFKGIVFRRSAPGEITAVVSPHDGDLFDTWPEEDFSGLVIQPVIETTGSGGPTMFTYSVGDKVKPRDMVPGTKFKVSAGDTDAEAYEVLGNDGKTLTYKTPHGEAPVQWDYEAGTLSPDYLVTEVPGGGTPLKLPLADFPPGTTAWRLDGTKGVVTMYQGKRRFEPLDGSMPTSPDELYLTDPIPAIAAKVQLATPVSAEPSQWVPDDLTPPSNWFNFNWDDAPTLRDLPTGTWIRQSPDDSGAVVSYKKGQMVGMILPDGTSAEWFGDLPVSGIGPDPQDPSFPSVLPHGLVKGGLVEHPEGRIGRLVGWDATVNAARVEDPHNLKSDVYVPKSLTPLPEPPQGKTYAGAIQKGNWFRDADGNAWQALTRNTNGDLVAISQDGSEEWTFPAKRALTPISHEDVKLVADAPPVYMAGFTPGEVFYTQEGEPVRVEPWGALTKQERDSFESQGLVPVRWVGQYDEKLAGFKPENLHTPPADPLPPSKSLAVGWTGPSSGLALGDLFRMEGGFGKTWKVTKPNWAESTDGEQSTALNGIEKVVKVGEDHSPNLHEIPPGEFGEIPFGRYFADPSENIWQKAGGGKAKLVVFKDGPATTVGAKYAFDPDAAVFPLAPEVAKAAIAASEGEVLGVVQPGYKPTQKWSPPPGITLPEGVQPQYPSEVGMDQLTVTDVILMPGGTTPYEVLRTDGGSLMVRNMLTGEMLPLNPASSMKVLRVADNIPF